MKKRISVRNETEKKNEHLELIKYNGQNIKTQWMNSIADWG